MLHTMMTALIELEPLPSPGGGCCLRPSDAPDIVTLGSSIVPKLRAHVRFYGIEWYMTAGCRAERRAEEAGS